MRFLAFCRRESRDKNQGFNTENSEKTESLALSFSRSATAPSRREPMIVRVFSLCRKENKDKIQGSKLKVRTFVFCCSAVGHYEPFWEEGVTRERDGRSPRDGKAAHFSFFAPQSDTE